MTSSVPATIGIKKIELEGFKTFKQKTTFDFRRGAGVVLVRGENQDKPSLGGNAVGKTSLVDAMYYCLFGKCLSGMGTSRVQTIGKEAKVKVSLDLSVGGRGVKIVRENTLRGIKATIETNGVTEAVDQQTIEGLLGYSAEAFKCTIFIPQDKPLFFDMLGSERRKVVESIFDVPVWTECIKICQKAKNKADMIDQLAEQEQILNDQLLTAVNQLKEFEHLKEKITLQKQTDSRLLKEDEAKYETVMKKISDEKDNHEAMKRKESIKRMRVELEGKRKALECRAIEIDKVKSRMQNITKKVDRFLEVEKGLYRCSDCEELFEKRPIECKEEDDRKAKKLTELELKFGELRKKYKGEECEVIGLREQFEKVGRVERVGEEQREEALKRKNDAERRLKSTHSSLSGLDGQIARQKENIEGLKGKKATVARRLEESSKVMAMAKGWGNGFGKIRSEVMANASKGLSSQVSKALDMLGMGGWGFEVDVSRQNAFDFRLESPDGVEYNPNQLSGCEKQFFRIATSAGLSDMVSIYRGKSIDIEVWDEPTAHLSRESVDTMVGFLVARAKDGGLKKTIYLIDHHSTSDPNLIGEVLISKKDGVSTIEDRM